MEIEPRIGVAVCNSMRIRELIPEDQDWIAARMIEFVGSTRVAFRGRAIETRSLPGFIAETDKGRIGFSHYQTSGHDCEVVTLNTTTSGEGAGTHLLNAVKAKSRELNCRRIWLVTTNDNSAALRFYQRYGFRLVAVRPGAIADARKLKPEIPELGHDEIPIRDEIELEITF